VLAAGFEEKFGEPAVWAALAATAAMFVVWESAAKFSVPVELGE
jgi:hypothetical protein